MGFSFLDLLFPPRASERLVRSLKKRSLSPYFAPRVIEFRNGDMTALLLYSEPLVQACVLEAKFHGNVPAAQALGEALAQYLYEELADRALYENQRYVLVPVPLSRARERARGYNQAEVIARHATIMLPELSVETRLVARIRDTLPQTSLSRDERIRNVRGAFRTIRKLDMNTCYIVIDDVVTTGATIGEVVKVLREARADAWAVAVTS